METKLTNEIKKISTPKRFHDGSSYKGLSIAQITALAKRYKVRGKVIEITALEQGIVPERYSRNMKTLSSQEQATLLKSRVGIVGLGGLGGGVTEILARIGIGSLILIDGDTFEDSNLNRQFFSTLNVISKLKTNSALRRVKQINSSIVVKTHSEYLNESNGIRLLNQSDVIVDCLDNLKTRFALERIARRIGSPLVSAAVAGVAGHVTTIYPEDRGLKLIYGEECLAPEKGAESLLGTLPQCVTTISALEASEVVKVLLKKDSTLRNKLLIVDLKDNTF